MYSQQKKAVPRPPSVDDDLTFDNLSDTEESVGQEKPSETVYQEDLTAMTVKLVSIFCVILYS